MADWQIRRAGPEALDELEPLWCAMHEHHASCSPAVAELLEFRTPAESWRRRRKSYEKWLGDPSTILLVAETPERAVGYALANLAGEGAVMVTGDVTAELESLSVLPEFRGEGVGAALIEELRRVLREAGVEVWGLSVFDGNDGGRRFYERQGLLPISVQLVGRV